MDWAKQANDMIKAWTGTQQKIWESWMSSMQAMATPQSPEAWQKTVETWRSTVRYAIEQQVELTRLWAESVAAASVNMPAMPSMPSIPGVPTTPVEWSRQMLEMTRVWAETQMRFSENWFDLLKKAEPSILAQVWDMNQAQKIMATWQEAAQKAFEAQTQFSQMVMKTATNSVDFSKK